MSVYIIQCLCPLRHCISAFAYEAEKPNDSKVEEFKAKIAGLIDAKKMDPWCGLCNSRDWRYEVEKTIFRTMDEARGPLCENALRQAIAREFFKRSRN
jgi:hypothetical protein